MKGIGRKETRKEIVSNVIILYGSVMLILPVMILLCSCYIYVMFLICLCYSFIILLLNFHYTENSYNSNAIPLTQFVLKRKSNLNEEDESSENEQEEYEEFIFETDDEGMCIIVLLVLYYYACIASVPYNNYFLSVMKPEFV